MTEPQKENERVEADRTEHAGHSVYTYETAGITERQGNVPVWLWSVVVSLLIWGVYYLVAYWNAPSGPV